jgi:hypothetical protein
MRLRLLIFTLSIMLGCVACTTNPVTGEERVSREQCKQTARDIGKATRLGCQLMFGGDQERVDICVDSANVAEAAAIVSCNASRHE